MLCRNLNKTLTRGGSMNSIAYFKIWYIAGKDGLTRRHPWYITGKLEIIRQHLWYITGTFSRTLFLLDLILVHRRHSILGSLRTHLSFGISPAHDGLSAPFRLYLGTSPAKFRYFNGNLGTSPATIGTTSAPIGILTAFFGISPAGWGLRTRTGFMIFLFNSFNSF